MDGDEAAAVLAEVEFIHPYGSLGPLPWRPGATGRSVPLGGGPETDLWRIGSRLRTFTESVKSDIGTRVTDAIAEAETILILGFGYLDQNLRLLTPMDEKRARRIISTAFGVSIPDQQVMRSAMANLGAGPPDMAMVEPGSCRDLFDHYRLTLSLS